MKTNQHIRERSGSVVECLTRDRRAAGLSPQRRHCVVSLSKNINPSLILVQPRKTRPFITERLLMGRKESNQTNKQISITSMQKELIDTQFLGAAQSMYLEVRPKKSILFLPLPLQYLQYVKRSIGWQTFFFIIFLYEK